MLKQSDIEILKWYQMMGVDEVHSNKRKNYSKSDISGESEIVMKQPLKEKLHVNAEGQSTKQIIPSLPQNDANASIQKSRTLANSCNSIEELRTVVTNFDDCELKATAANTVFADGNSSAKVMLIGEAPGANEDAQGIPFCGDSGKLLDNIIKSIGLDRTNSYITNTIFWRPPGNRRPSEIELAMCLPFVEKHIALVRPDLIILVGGTASLALFGDLGPITKQRQKVLEYTNQYLSEPIKSVVIFHPSYLMRQPSQKKLAWQDMLFIKNILN